MLLRNEINIFSCIVGLLKWYSLCDRLIFCFTSSRVDGLFFFIISEWIADSLALASGFLRRQLFSPLGTSMYFILSIIDCVRDFVGIPNLSDAFLNVSLDRSLSLSIFRRLIP